MLGKPLFKKIHLILGLISGLIVLVVCLTGAIYVFGEDIRDLTEHNIRYCTFERHQEKLSPEKIRQSAYQFLQQKQVDLDTNHIIWENLVRYNDPTKTDLYSIKLSDPDPKYFMYINPYTAQVLFYRNKWAGNFWVLMVKLHTSLLLGDVGEQLVHYGTLAFFILMITGIILWWPKNKAALKQRLWFKWKESTKWKRKNYDIHNILGFYSLWVMIAIVVVGLYWSFGWFKDALFVVMQAKETETNYTILPTSNASHIKGVDACFDYVDKHYESAYAYEIGFPCSVTEPVEIYVQHSEIKSGGDKLWFNNHTQQLIHKSEFASLNVADKLDNMANDIHFGWILGLPGKILAFLASIIVASLPITGFLIWRGRKK